MHCNVIWNLYSRLKIKGLLLTCLCIGASRDALNFQAYAALKQMSSAVIRVQELDRLRPWTFYFSCLVLADCRVVFLAAITSKDILQRNKREINIQ